MSLLERILFWIVIIILLIAVIGERTKLSALSQQVEKSKNINVIYQGESEEEEEGEDEGEDEGEGGSDTTDENSDEGDEGDEDEEDEGSEETDGGEE